MTTFWLICFLQCLTFLEWVCVLWSFHCFTLEQMFSTLCQAVSSNCFLSPDLTWDDHPVSVQSSHSSFSWYVLIKAVRVEFTISVSDYMAIGFEAFASSTKAMSRPKLGLWLFTFIIVKLFFSTNPSVCKMFKSSPRWRFQISSFVRPTKTQRYSV